MVAVRLIYTHLHGDTTDLQPPHLVIDGCVYMTWRRRGSARPPPSANESSGTRQSQAPGRLILVRFGVFVRTPRMIRTRG